MDKSQRKYKYVFDGGFYKIDEKVLQQLVTIYEDPLT